MAVGKCFDEPIVPMRTDAWINGYAVVKGGARLDFDEAIVRAGLAVENVEIEVSVGSGNAEAIAYGCDLTKGYIDENASYYSS